MPSKPVYARIAITIPEHDLAAADSLARDRDRSRSWIISEALRQYVALHAPDATNRTLAAKRHAQLVADLRLTPEGRVRTAEAKIRAVSSRKSRRGVKTAGRVIFFDRFEDYLAWKEREGHGS